MNFTQNFDSEYNNFSKMAFSPKLKVVCLRSATLWYLLHFEPIVQKRVPLRLYYDFPEPSYDFRLFIKCLDPRWIKFVTLSLKFQSLDQIEEMLSDQDRMWEEGNTYSVYNASIVDRNGVSFFPTLIFTWQHFFYVCFVSVIFLSLKNRENNHADKLD